MHTRDDSPAPRPATRRQTLACGAAAALAPVATLLPGCGGDAAVRPADIDPRNTAPDRSMTIQVTNHLPDQALAFGAAVGLGGATAPQAQPAVLAPGAECTVVASSRGTDCDGSFRLEGGHAGFEVRYRHPHGPGATTVQATPSAGGLAATNRPSYAGHHAVARLRLYQGVPTAAGPHVAPLGLLQQPAWNNAQDFINSLYADGVRSQAVIEAAIQADGGATGLVAPADFTGGQLAPMTALWTRHWLGQDRSVLPPTDARLAELLARYIDTACRTGPLALWVPQLRLQASPAAAVYRLEGYRRHGLREATGDWSAEGVQAFLGLLLSGAHLVAICARADLPPGVEVEPFDRFLSRSAAPTRYDIGSSHYATVVNTTGHYYLGVEGNFAPEDCGLLLALLNGRTVNNALLGAGQYNSFIQLEGWQAGAARHNADYALHTRTLWNISTFGASVYSEKRATTVFLAPAGWTPQVFQGTCMMPYLGAYARSAQRAQPWLRRDLVTLPDDAPALPPRFIAG